MLLSPISIWRKASWMAFSVSYPLWVLARCLELRGGWFKFRIAVELSGRKGMGRKTQAGVICVTSFAASPVLTRDAA